MAGIDGCSAGIVGSITGTCSLGEAVLVAELGEGTVDDGLGSETITGLTWCNHKQNWMPGAFCELVGSGFHRRYTDAICG
ncbi:hypothetical protein M0R45_019799 [Rubus argutus]|uniref:Uncharacterized protein n=1 Tax=Rubus argutus TaxID=59490 RepID=A0AAW1X9W7_RUBAR